MFVKVVEGNRERLQNFEGTVIKMQGGAVRKSFTVRRVSYGVGVERTFPYNSPRIGRIEVVPTVRFAAPSSTICAIAPARLPRSRNVSSFRIRRTNQKANEDPTATLAHCQPGSGFFYTGEE